MISHAQLPWNYEDSSYANYLIKSGKLIIAETYNSENHAKLICLAVNCHYELLVALEELLDDYSGNGLQGKAGLQACKAIAKARGEL